MGEKLYTKYLFNISNDKLAIKKEYVRKGYFVYYSKKDIEYKIKSNKILIDGVNEFYDDFIDKVCSNIINKKPISNKKIYLGRIGKKLKEKINHCYPNSDIKLDFNIVIGESEIKHAFNNHSNKNEIKRGQKIIEISDIKNIPILLMNVNKIKYLGVNENHQKVYNFISNNQDGTYNLLEFVSKGKYILGFQSLYINKKRLMP